LKGFVGPNSYIKSKPELIEKSGIDRVARRRIFLMWINQRRWSMIKDKNYVTVWVNSMNRELTYAELNERHKTKVDAEKRVREKHPKQLYWFTLPQGLRLVFLATLARKISL